MANTNAVAPQTQKVLPTPEEYWKYWEGQRKINGLLFQTDMSLVGAILELKKVVAKILELHADDPRLQIDLSGFYDFVGKAKEYTEQVPAVDPPGCSTPPY